MLRDMVGSNIEKNHLRKGDYLNLIEWEKLITVSIRRTLYMESYIDYEKAK